MKDEENIRLHKHYQANIQRPKDNNTVINKDNLKEMWYELQYGFQKFKNLKVCDSEIPITNYL